MSDFSLFSLFTAGLALFAAVGDCYTKPVGAQPKGNPITQPGFMSIVPAGKPFTVTWEPTTDGTVTLVLLKGPSENAIPQYPIAEKIKNDGSFVWTPKKNLEPTADATGYGIQLIVDSNGQYQYTTQFGISNPSYSADETTSAASSTESAGGWGSHGHGGHGQGGWGHGGHNVHGGYTHASASGTASGLTSSYTHNANGTTSAGSAHPTGYGPHNVTMVSATGGSSTSKPAVSTSASGYGGSSASVSTPAGPQATDNGAVAMVSSLGGLVLAAGAAVLAL